MSRLQGFGPLIYVPVNAAASGNNTLCAAAGAGLRIALCQAFISSAGAVVAKIQDGADGTSMIDMIDLNGSGGFVLPPSLDEGWCITSANTLLNLNLSGAVQCGGVLGIRIGQ